MNFNYSSSTAKWALNRILFLFVLPVALVACEPQPMDVAVDREMPEIPTPRERVEAVHVLMHHGLAMASEGADLIMISQLGLEPNLDVESLTHGRESIAAGRELIDRALAVNSELADEVPAVMLDYTSRLGDSYLAIADVLDNMDAPDIESDTAALHHMHMMLNHALRMAADGSNLRMLGTSDRDVSVAQLGGEHGARMLANARAMVDQVLTGPSMENAHAQGLTGGPMRTAHMLAESIQSVISMMEEMPV